MNLRWLEKENGERALQFSLESEPENHDWHDIPTVKEKKKPREFWIQQYDQGEKLNVTLVRDGDNPKFYQDEGYIKVREVTPDE